MNLRALSLVVPLLFLARVAGAQTPIDIENPAHLQRSNTLSTCEYSPVEKEKPFFHRVPDKERVTGSAFGPPFAIHDKQGKYVSWFGIVRGITPPAPDAKTTTLLLEQKYFDGLTDCHIMLVAFAGDGDFLATLEVDPASIPALSLVKVYGKVVDEHDGVPLVAVEYLRVWPWFGFTFTNLAAEDHGNPRWAQFCETCKRKGKIYDPWPVESYYRGLLGDPNDFGLHLDEGK
jgi:hypothetical protein